MVRVFIACFLYDIEAISKRRMMRFGGLSRADYYDALIRCRVLRGRVRGLGRIERHMQNMVYWIDQHRYKRPPSVEELALLDQLFGPRP